MQLRRATPEKKKHYSYYRCQKACRFKMLLQFVLYYKILAVVSVPIVVAVFTICSVSFLYICAMFSL